MRDPAESFPVFQKTTTQLVVNVSVNAEAKGDFFAEIDDEGKLYFKVEDLVSLKLKIAQERVVLIKGEKFAPLGAIRDVQSTFDEKNLTLTIVGKTAENRQTTIELYPPHSTPPDVYYPRETSAFLNYGLSYLYTNPAGFQSFTSANKLGARTGDVFLVSDSLYTKTEFGSQFVRLTSSATYERRNDLQWLVVGDQFASSGDLGSTINLGGVGFSKVYKMDPYFTKQQMFSLRGVTAYPSQAQIYIDGVPAGNYTVAPGTFELKNIYSYPGNHNVEIRLRDPFGNEQKISYPVYFSAQLLGEGLHEYSYNVGFLREDFGVKSSEYGKPALSAFHRYGVTSSLNIGARAEGADGVYNGGILSSFTLPRTGSFDLSLAGSMNHGQRGAASSLLHSYQHGTFSTNLHFSFFSRQYSTVSLLASPDMTKTEGGAGVAFLAEPLGGISLSFSESENYRGVDTRIISASFSRSLTRTVSMFTTVSETRVQDTTYGFFIGINFMPSRDIHGAVQYNKTGGADTETVQIQKDTPIGEGLGYRGSLNRTESGASTSYSLNPSLTYNAKYGTYSLDASIQNSHGNENQIYNVGAAGAFVYAGGIYGLSRPVSDSFAIVMVDTVAGATIQNNGQEIGQTASSGTLIVPTLASYSQNHITVDTKNMPMDYSMPGVSSKINPSLWSGSCVAFDALKVRSVTGSVYVMKAVKRVPLEFSDISIKVGEKEVAFPTGKDGEFYMENTLADDAAGGIADKQSCRAISERRKSGGNYIHPGTYRAWVDTEGGRCEFLVTFPNTEDVISDIGDVECVMNRK
jgi:outer membrane usher protein